MALLINLGLTWILKRFSVCLYDNLKFFDINIRMIWAVVFDNML